MEALNISLSGTVTVKLPVSPVRCSDVPTTQAALPFSLAASSFTISARYNSLAVFGCKNSVWLRANETTTLGGCTALCDANSTATSCNGVNCCQTTIPPRLKDLRYTYKSNEPSSNASCGHVFPVDKKWLKDRRQSADFRFVPLVLEWEFGEQRGGTDDFCTYSDDYCFKYPNDYSRREFDSSFCSSYNYDNRYTDYYHNENHDYVSSTKYCSCPRGYEGNPYLPEGCTDINECSDSTLNQCSQGYDCFNSPGGYGCANNFPNESKKSRVRTGLISVGSALGGLILLAVAWKAAKAISKRIKANRRRNFFKRNGGLLLEQQLSATETGLHKTKLFSTKELTKATDRYNENRIVGRGGQGTVYKGMLTDGLIVAVKKSKKVEEGDLEVFINEVVILSQVNHRNVVKLLGCCLETEVPLLVYEFIPNGTLFQHIHDPNEELPLTWEMRLRIAREVAGALAYLHSASSAPIYHRDIKSTNILLDDKYRAKIADFGTSRSVSIDQTHLTTRVVGTFGYLDPEYFRSSQFTEKSDVYSFGVVMVELLTGEKAISSIRPESGRSLATHYLHSMEENQLFEILDARVLEEGKREEIAAIGELARRCLNLDGKRRPTMKEVAMELEGIQMLKEGLTFLQNQGKSRVSVADFCCISESMHFDTILDLPDADQYPLLDEPCGTLQHYHLIPFSDFFYYLVMYV
ncbi:hypothetical protein ACS0TY_033453 [Phlomoides rotata]